MARRGRAQLGVRRYFCYGRISPSCDFSRFDSGSWGDLMAPGSALYRNVDWIDSIVAVPEPEERAALMLAGLAAVAGVAPPSRGRLNPVCPARATRAGTGS